MVDIIKWNSTSDVMPKLDGRKSIPVLIIGSDGTVSSCNYVDSNEIWVKDFNPDELEVVTIKDVECFAFEYFDSGYYEPAHYYVRINNVKYWAYLPENKKF